jgi:hypothetical protein
MINNLTNTSAVKKNSYMLSNNPNMNSAMQALMVPSSHKRRSGYKLSLLSGSGSGMQSSLFKPKNLNNGPNSGEPFNTCELLLSGSKYEDSSMSSLSSAKKQDGQGSSSGMDIGAPTNNSSNASAYKMGSGMMIIPHISVEESSDSEDEEADQQILEEEDEQQSPRQLDP